MNNVWLDVLNALEQRIQKCSSKSLIKKAHHKVSSKSLIKKFYQKVSSKSFTIKSHQKVSLKSLIIKSHQNVSSRTQFSPWIEPRKTDAPHFCMGQDCLWDSREAKKRIGIPFHSQCCSSLSQRERERGLFKVMETGIVN